MSGEEQAINVSEWKELHAELEEVRDKHGRLQAANNRLVQVIEDIREEREQAVKVAAAFQIQVASLQEQLQEVTLQRDNASANVDSLRAEYRKAKEAANTNSDKAAALLEQVAGMNVALNEMREQRNAMELNADQMRGSVDAAHKTAASAYQDFLQMVAERDAAAAQWEECCEDRSRQVAALREQLVEMTASRDNFERLCKEWRIEFDAISAKKDDLQAQLSQWQVEHDAAREELAQAKEAADMFAAENTSLQDTVRQLRVKQVHDDLPGILRAIQLAVEQARELI